MVLLFGWLLPLILIATIVLYFVTSTINSQIMRTIEESTDKAVEICEIYLNEAVRASKNATYISTIENSYHQYLLDGREQVLFRQITNFLNQYYTYNDSFLSTMLFFLDNPGQIYYTVNAYRVSDMTLTGYDTVQNFIDFCQADVMERGLSLENELELMYLDDRLYLVRNIVDTYYQPYAMLVIELDVTRIFHSLDSIWGAANYEVLVDGREVLNNGIDSASITSRFSDDFNRSITNRYQNTAYSYKSIEFGKHTITFLIDLDSRSLLREVTIARYIYILVAIFLLPFFYLIFNFFRQRVTKPISKLIDASKKIKEGDYGYEISNDSSSEEFTFLIDAYNAMSKELKHQFQRIFLEELAVRDASIEALQSQINPHFLNNTLEIINWEARMNGNEKVTMMIEALSTMLDFTMNREQKKYHSLADEIDYVDAYLYIIGQRFGARFHVDKEIDESLLSTTIPRLIVQPLLENAVEHGMKDRKKANILVQVKKDDGKIIILIINDRKLKDSEKEKIDALLSEKAEVKNWSGSLGLRNVNKRLKIIYGEDSGLDISNDENDRTVSRILIPV
ncbi:MAG: histidine kinase [Lachnospiraceae bacterium]|nr:histidine kinase [Lachnospiraceae bacterium]